MLRSEKQNGKGRSMIRKATWKNLSALFTICASVFLCLGQAEAFIFQDRVSFSKSLAHYAMGHAYDLMDMTNRAVLEYEQASQYDDSSYLIQLRLGTDYARLNLLKDAIEKLKRVNQLNPEELQSRYLLALIYSNQMDYESAAREFEFILTRFSEYDPENVEIYGYLGQLYSSQQIVYILLKLYFPPSWICIGSGKSTNQTNRMVRRVPFQVRGVQLVRTA